MKRMCSLIQKPFMLGKVHYTVLEEFDFYKEISEKDLLSLLSVMKQADLVVIEERGSRNFFSLLVTERQIVVQTFFFLVSSA